MPRCFRMANYSPANFAVPDNAAVLAQSFESFGGQVGTIQESESEVFRQRRIGGSVDLRRGVFIALLWLRSGVRPRRSRSCSIMKRHTQNSALASASAPFTGSITVDPI